MSSGVSESTWQSPKIPCCFKGGGGTGKQDRPIYPQYSAFAFNSKGKQVRWAKDLACSHFQRGIVTTGAKMTSPAPKKHQSYDSHNKPDPAIYNNKNLSKLASDVMKTAATNRRIPNMVGRGFRTF
jgi:hypothetical protein